MVFRAVFYEKRRYFWDLARGKTGSMSDSDKVKAFTLDELEAKARAATAGPWEYQKESDVKAALDKIAGKP